jgi:hypothetical protein
MRGRIFTPTSTGQAEDMKEYDAYTKMGQVLRGRGDNFIRSNMGPAPPTNMGRSRVYAGNIFVPVLTQLRMIGGGGGG